MQPERTRLSLLFSEHVRHLAFTLRHTFTNHYTRLLRCVGEDEENSSPTRNSYKIRTFRMAAAAIEKLDFQVEHSKQLMGVRIATPVSSFVVTESVFR